MLKRLAAYLCASVMCGTVMAGPLAAQSEQHPEVRTASGKLKGAAEKDVVAFKGIPYAAAPTGERRWRPPVAPANWRGVRDASRYGAACPQPDDHKEAWARVGPTSEDCLFLNVWRPAAPGKYPVMVFLHGGGFTYGAAGVPLYDGANLARRGVVLVSMNYRLGLLGFLAHPALTKADPGSLLGNYGIMDQIEALRWVQRNIAAFGGDPHNVTIFGESAGAGVVQVLMGSPQAKGLFNKAVSQSGAGGSVLMPIRGASVSAESVGEQWAKSVGLPDATAAQLRALPVERLIKRSFPFIDGTVVVASPGAPFAAGTEMKFPLIIGANSNEATLAGNNEGQARRVLGDAYDQALADYQIASGDRVKTRLAEDSLSILPSFSIAAMHAANGAKAYAYYFDQVPASRRADWPGTPHGGELEYLFGNPDEGSIWDEADKRASQAMAAYWVNFARTGNPNGAGLPAWAPVSGSGNLTYLAIESTPHQEALTNLRENVRQRSLATSRSGWTAQQSK